jgi:hypothetical protein
MFTTSNTNGNGAPIAARRIALPPPPKTATGTKMMGKSFTPARVTSFNRTKTSPTGSTGEAGTEALDMRLGMDYDSHKCVLKLVVKTKLFPLVKFITEGTTDMQFSDVKGICGFLVRHCNVGGDARMWWQTYHRVVRRIVNDHRNNKIKCIQNAYYGKSKSLDHPVC